MTFFCSSDIRVRDDLFHFVPPISAALGFKLFSNAALRAKSLPTPVIEQSFSTEVHETLTRRPQEKIY